MPRNKKIRQVLAQPPVAMFKPAGIPARDLGRVALRLDEYEALRLADYEGLHQEEVAERLGVSRPTVTRILEEAHRTVAAALVYGHVLLIEGGPVCVGPMAPPCGGGGRRWRHRGGHGGPHFGNHGQCI